MSNGRSAFSFVGPARAAGLLGVAGLAWLSSCSSEGGAKVLPPPTGHYEGRISYQGADLRTALDLREIKPGQLQADLRFADLQGLGFPAENLTFKSPQLHFERQPGAVGNMAVDAIREGDFLRGFFSTDSVKADLLLVRRGKPDPRPYRTQTLQFRSGPLTFRGSLLIPDDTLSRHPAVVLLHAADAPRQRDLNAYADLLARQGFMTLVYDRRDASQPGSPAAQLLAEDAQAAVQALRKNAAVDSARVGLWGIRQGGNVAALAAGQPGRQVAFVVSLSAPGISPAAARQEQMTARLRQQGVKQAQIRQAQQAAAQLERYVRRGNEGDSAQLHQALQRIGPEPWVSLTELPRRVPTAAELQSQPQWRDFLLDPRTAWQQVRVPVLLLYGAADTHFNARESAQRLRGVVGYRRGSAVRVYANADHELMLPSGVRPDTDGRWDWSRPAPGAVEDMLTWMKQAVK
ncbi:alpha/beta hydrolase [Hymenobacter persicinus]|uniref:Uncharacterized protein n=1 Tax=Hymenobacter persicinus TaxID=2025506 RepID=A0A4Q5LG75_9BACT|nr:alpha/beta hydrolase [Hymenobacter persicinus]RYU84424.1 hypothetical protein EWM57_01670 [Hymenobacter persicinus]